MGKSVKAKFRNMILREQ
jgi:hypothetical protein